MQKWPPRVGGEPGPSRHGATVFLPWLPPGVVRAGAAVTMFAVTAGVAAEVFGSFLGDVLQPVLPVGSAKPTAALALAVTAGLAGEFAIPRAWERLQGRLG